MKFTEEEGDKLRSALAEADLDIAEHHANRIERRVNAVYKWVGVISLCIGGLLLFMITLTGLSVVYNTEPEYVYAFAVCAFFGGSYYFSEIKKDKSGDT